MADIWDTVESVEKNPDDHAQRWRLAKQLYGAWEYDQALLHLVVLRQKWEPKLNVYRYLAACLFRLGRHEEAVTELRGAIALWPDEVGLHEQLTRVLESMGAHARAREVWEEIALKHPDHPLAAKAITKLRRRESAEARPPVAGVRAARDLVGFESPRRDSSGALDGEDGYYSSSTSEQRGVEAGRGTLACPRCGAANVGTVPRCWQCGARIADDPFSEFDRTEDQETGVAFSPETVSMAAIATVVALLLLGLYLSVPMLGGFGQDGGGGAVRTMWELYEFQIGYSRAVTGLVAVLFWPLAFYLTLLLVPPAKPVPGMLTTLAGLLMGSLAYAASFLPPPLTLLMVFLPMLLSLMLVLSTFGMPVGRAVGVWAVQFGMVVLVAAAAFVTSESILLKEPFNPLREAVAVAGFMGTPAGETGPGSHRFPQDAVPVSQDIVWHSTGSAWLDRRADEVSFTLKADRGGAQLKFQIYDETGARVFDYVQESRYTKLFSVIPGKKYTVAVSGEKGVVAQVILEGLLRPEFLN
jgi:hypothetical protein